MEEPVTAYLDELDDLEPHDGPQALPAAHDRWLTATFLGYVRLPDGTIEDCDGLPLGEALAWAWARAPRVVLRVGDDPREFDAGEHAPGDLMRWPPDDLELPLRRRRPPDERWKDRTAADPAIRWSVAVALRVPDQRYDELVGDRAALEAEAEAIVARAAPLSCSRDGVDGFLADLRAAARAARGAEVFGWTTRHDPAWVLRFEVDAATREQAAAAGVRRVGAAPGWIVAAAAAPA